MKIAMIDGSPKYTISNSSRLLEKLEPMIRDNNEIAHYHLATKPFTEGQYLELCSMDVLVFSFPLYVDSIPSHLLRMLLKLEGFMKTNRQKPVTVYAIVNNGFYEGKQNHIAIRILENWCLKCGITFGQGIGMGAGEMLDFINNIPLGHGPLKNLGAAFQGLTDSMKTRTSGKPIYLSPNFPRFAWRFSAINFVWNANARKNGLKKKDILKQL